MDRRDLLKTLGGASAISAVGTTDASKPSLADVIILRFEGSLTHKEIRHLDEMLVQLFPEKRAKFIVLGSVVQIELKKS